MNYKPGSGLFCGSNINASSFLESLENWQEDKEKRFNLDKLNASFRESVPVLDFLKWEITSVKRGYCETLLPLNPNSSNQYITHQAALILLAADYTGGLALASLFHLTPVIGFWESFDGYGIYMWGAKSDIKWYYPSCDDLVCRASIDRNSWDILLRRMLAHKKVVFTVKIEMFNGKKLVAESNFTYWAQDIEGLRKDAFDNSKIAVLYEHKLKTTAKLIAGLRSMESDLPIKDRRFEDSYSKILAGKHGTVLSQRFMKTIPQIQNMVAARTKHVDQLVMEYVKDKEMVNIVNIGSGYDSRFWRLEVENANIYDLDLPIMLDDRKKFFNYKSKNNVKCIPIDLITQGVDQVLSNKDVGFDQKLPTLFIWEGGSMYFGQQEIDKIFSSIAKMMFNGCQMWFDYVCLDAIENRTGIEEIENFMKNMAKMGEAFINGFDDVKLFAKKYGLKVLVNKSSGSVLSIEEPHYEYYKFCILSK